MADAGNPPLGARHILVVEDEAIVGRGLVAYLEDIGACVTWTTSLEESLEAVEQADPIDAAVVDFNLAGAMSTPVLDELLRRKVYTVLCTGYDLGSIPARFHDLPLMQKPFTRRAINRLLVEHLDRVGDDTSMVT